MLWKNQLFFLFFYFVIVTTSNIQQELCSPNFGTLQCLLGSGIRIHEAYTTTTHESQEYFRSFTIDLRSTCDGLRKCDFTLKGSNNEFNQHACINVSYSCYPLLHSTVMYSNMSSLSRETYVRESTEMLQVRDLLLRGILPGKKQIKRERETGQINEEQINRQKKGEEITGQINEEKKSGQNGSGDSQREKEIKALELVACAKTDCSKLYPPNAVIYPPKQASRFSFLLQYSLPSLSLSIPLSSSPSSSPPLPPVSTKSSKDKKNDICGVELVRACIGTLHDMIDTIPTKKLWWAEETSNFSTPPHMVNSCVELNPYIFKIESHHISPSGDGRGEESRGDGRGEERRAIRISMDSCELEKARAFSLRFEVEIKSCDSSLKNLRTYLDSGAIESQDRIPLWQVKIVDSPMFGSNTKKTVATPIRAHAMEKESLISAKVVVIFLLVVFSMFLVVGNVIYRLSEDKKKLSILWDSSLGKRRKSDVGESGELYISPVASRKGFTEISPISSGYTSSDTGKCDRQMTEWSRKPVLPKENGVLKAPSRPTPRSKGLKKSVLSIPKSLAQIRTQAKWKCD